jgi:TetR/AcrR family transcriptional regulator, cholesterol catabolism regulator
MEEKDIKDRILKGAEELLLKYSVRSVSMDDIARHLSMSKKTIYQYFADKDEIVTMVAADHMEKNRVKFDSFRSAAKDAIDELMRISICLRIDFQKMNPSLLYDLQKYHSKAWNVWLEHKQHHVRESIIANLKQGIEEGYYRPEINTEILANTRLELIQLAFDDRVFNPSKFNLAEVHLQIFEHFIYGLLTDKGRKVYEKYKKESINQELIPSYE